MRKMVSVGATILLSVTFCLAQKDSAQTRPRYEVIIDGGIPLIRDTGIGSATWSHQWSIRGAVGIVLDKVVTLDLFIEYDRYLVNTQWGDLEAKVFDKKYPRNDVGLCASLTFARWVVVGAGAMVEFRQDMVYHDQSAIARDTTKRVLSGSSALTPFFVVGLKYDVPLGEGFFAPIGVYLHDLQPFHPIARIGLTKQF